jgi:uncharacterized membrane protein YphA (DoxX/SURF4 family)
MSLAMNASGAPAWYAALDNHLSGLVPYDGVSVVIDLVALQAFAGLGVLLGRRTRRAAVVVGIGLSLAYWVAGQDLAQFWSGITTDPDTGPVVILLGVAVFGAAPWNQPGSGTKPERGRTVQARRHDRDRGYLGALGGRRRAAQPQMQPDRPVGAAEPIESDIQDISVVGISEHTGLFPALPG